MVRGVAVAAAEIGEPRWLLLLLLSLPPLHFPSSSTRALLPLCSTCLPSLLIDCHCVWSLEWCDLRECGGEVAERQAKGRLTEGRSDRDPPASSEQRATPAQTERGRREETERDGMDDEMKST